MFPSLDGFCADSCPPPNLRHLPAQPLCFCYRGIVSSSLMNRLWLRRYAWLSIAAAIATIALKSLAYWLTSSVGLLSDAIESIVNLVGALMALAMLTVAARPPDEDHPYGYSKAEYFSSGVEGTMIFIAAISI